MIRPTKDLYSLFDMIYDYYNQNLFNNELPNCMFVVVRKNGSFGYYIAKKWVNSKNDITDEIAINPMMFGKYPIIEILQTIVHEMTHLWQQNIGTPPTKFYHDKEWGSKMEAIGLMPSNTGRVGGSRTGQQMMDYIINGSLFDIKTKELLKQDVFSKLWLDVSTPYVKGINELFDSISILNNEQSFNLQIIDTANFSEEENDNNSSAKPIKNIKDKSKVKYTCPNCNFNVWGKIGLSIVCGDCDSNYT